MNNRSYNRILSHTAEAWTALEEHRTARKAELIRNIKAEIAGAPDRAQDILIAKIAGIKAAQEVTPMLIAATVEGSCRSEAAMVALNAILAPARFVIDTTGGCIKAAAGLFRRKAKETATEPSPEVAPAAA